MDITEIKAKYLEILAEKCLTCFNNIDSVLVNSYNKIMKHEQIEISEARVSYSEFENVVYHDDMVQEIIYHYSKNWNVTYKDKNIRKKEKVFIFSYKGDLEIGIQESKQKTEIKEVVDKEFKTDRCSILDFK